MFKRVVTSALIFGAAALGPPAHAQSVVPCMERDALVERLTGMYSETMVGGGLRNAEQMLEVWRSEETGSFTVIVTHANGVSCILAAGQHWQPPRITPEGVTG